MKSNKIHMGLFAEHLNAYGIEGLLPQNLSERLLKILSDEFDDFKQEDREKKGGTRLLIDAVLCFFLENDEKSFETLESIEISPDELYEAISTYGLSIIFEEIRRAGLIDISEENLPTLNNILDAHRELIVTGDSEAVNNFMKDYQQ